MPYDKGEGGRPKGALNRTTAQMREVMSAIHNKFLDQLEEDLNAMSPMNRWTILTKLAPFHMPTLSKNENSNTASGQVTIRVEYSDAPSLVDLGEVQTVPVQELPATPVLNQLAKTELDWMDVPVRSEL